MDMLIELLKDETGASAMEYCMLICFIAIGVAVSITILGQSISNMFIKFSTDLSTAMGS